MKYRIKISFLLDSKEIFYFHSTPFLYILYKTKKNPCELERVKYNYQTRTFVDLDRAGFAQQLNKKEYYLFSDDNIDNIPLKEKFYCGLKTMEVNTIFLKQLIDFAQKQSIPRWTLIVRVYYLLYYKTQLYLKKDRAALLTKEAYDFMKFVCNRRKNELLTAIDFLIKFGAIYKDNNNLYILNQKTNPHNGKTKSNNS